MVHDQQHAASRRDKRRGAIVVFFAVLLVIVIGMIALAADTGMMMVTRTNLQRSTDAAVLAAADLLAQDDSTEQEVVAEANNFLTANGVDPSSFQQGAITIEFGTWDSDTRTFTTESFEDATAIRMALESTGHGLFFGNIFGADSFDVATEAIAITTSPHVERDIMLVLDCSTSMDADSDNPEQPMTAVKDGGQTLCDAIGSKDRVGLTVYNWEDPDEDRDTGHVEVGLTDTPQFVKTRINDLHAGFYEGGTNIAGGIAVGGMSLNADARSEAKKILVVLTDGRANDEEPPYDTSSYNSEESALAWANDIRALGIIIHTVSVGDGADHQLMAEVAGGSLSEDDPLKGKHFQIEGDIADYSDQLIEAFEDIGQGTGVALVH